MDWSLYDIGLRRERVNGAEGIVRCKDFENDTKGSERTRDFSEF